MPFLRKFGGVTPKPGDFVESVDFDELTEVFVITDFTIVD